MERPCAGSAACMIMGWREQVAGACMPMHYCVGAHAWLSRVWTIPSQLPCRPGPCQPDGHLVEVALGFCTVLNLHPALGGLVRPCLHPVSRPNVETPNRFPCIATPCAALATFGAVRYWACSAPESATLRFHSPYLEA
eukprot:365104-Chlamydomonas_euryale.AAC.17